MDINFQIPAGEDFIRAGLCICVVMLALAMLAILIVLISKIIRIIESAATKKASKKSAPAVQPAPAAVSVADDCEVELIGVDEKTAAVIMAIISQRSEIPLNRLRFKSIKLVDDSEKGGAAK